MFDVGFTEMLLIGVVALVVIGPERLPDVARTIGQYVGKLQRFVTGVKRDFKKELEAGELKKLIGDQKDQIDELRKMVDTTRRDFEKNGTEVTGDAKARFEEIQRAAGHGPKTADGAAAGAAKAEVDGETKVQAATETPVDTSNMPADGSWASNTKADIADTDGASEPAARRAAGADDGA